MPKTNTAKVTKVASPATSKLPGKKTGFATAALGFITAAFAPLKEADAAKVDYGLFKKNYRDTEVQDNSPEVLNEAKEIFEGVAGPSGTPVKKTLTKGDSSKVLAVIQGLTGLPETETYDDATIRAFAITLQLIGSSASISPLTDDGLGDILKNLDTLRCVAQITSVLDYEADPNTETPRLPGKNDYRKLGDSLSKHMFRLSKVDPSTRTRLASNDAIVAISKFRSDPKTRVKVGDTNDVVPLLRDLLGKPNPSDPTEFTQDIADVIRIMECWRVRYAVDPKVRANDGDLQAYADAIFKGKADTTGDLTGNSLCTVLNFASMDTAHFFRNTTGEMIGRGVLPQLPGYRSKESDLEKVLAAIATSGWTPATTP